MAIGIAKFEGRLTLKEKVLNFFPEYQTTATTGSDKIPVEHLMQMSSGHSFEDYSKYNEIDRAELFFSTERTEEPGEGFYYEDLCTYMLGRIIEKLSGHNLLAYLKPRLFDKLDIINPQWHTCQKGHTACSGGLFLTTEEFSKLGVLLLNKSIYNDQQIVTADYVKKCIQIG